MVTICVFVLAMAAMVTAAVVISAAMVCTALRETRKEMEKANGALLLISNRLLNTANQIGMARDVAWRNTDRLILSNTANLYRFCKAYFRDSHEDSVRKADDFIRALRDFEEERKQEETNGGIR